MFSLIIPAYNEEGAIEETVRRAHYALCAWGQPFEIIVVNDGSTDRTQHILRRIKLARVRVIHHPKNRGNGASILSGVQHAQGTLMGTVDADGTYPLESFEALLATLDDPAVAMVVGERSKAVTPRLQLLAKAILTRYAEHCVGRKIPDINSGMRIVRRELLERWMFLYPERFSLHITLTLCALFSGEHVRYMPIEYYKRIGVSSMTSGMNGIKHFFAFLVLITRITRILQHERGVKRPFGMFAARE